MIGCLRIEFQGYGDYQKIKGYSRLLGGAESVPPSVWCAEITGFDAKYKYVRKFLKPYIDYADANSVASRGVYYEYCLETDKIYEVYNGNAGAREEKRYFCMVHNTAEIVIVNEDFVKTWLQDRKSASE